MCVNHPGMIIELPSVNEKSTWGNRRFHGISQDRCRCSIWNWLIPQVSRRSAASGSSLRLHRTFYYCWLLTGCCFLQGWISFKCRTCGAFYPCLTAGPDAPPLETALVFPVIMPQTKHASSRATAVTATFLFFPCRIIL